MPRERLSMRTIREVLRLRWEAGLSHRAIALSCRKGQTTVRDCLLRAQAAGLSWPLPAGMDEEQLERLLYPPPPESARRRPLPDWSAIHQELRRKGVTLGLLWQEYRAAHPDGYQYSQFCELYRGWERVLEPVLRQHYVAGERLFVDYAGQTMPVVDRRTGEVREAQIFVAVLGASNFTYVEATWSQGLPDWIGSHRRCFEFLGGVPALIIPDNVTSGVTSPCFYDPDLNRTYQKLAEHYGAAVLPARVRRPPGQGEGRDGRPGGGALDSRPAAASAFLLPRGVERSDLGAARGVQPPTLPETGRLPGVALSRARPARPPAPARPALRVPGVEESPGQHRLPRGGGPALLLRALPDPGRPSRGVPHRPHRGDPPQRNAGGVASALIPARWAHHAPRAHAPPSPRVCAVESRSPDPLGAADRAGHRPGGGADPRLPRPPRPGLPGGPGGAALGQAPWSGAAGGGLCPRAGTECAQLQEH